MTGQDPFDRIRTYLDIAQRAFEEIAIPAPEEDEGFDEVRDVLDKLGVDKPAPNCPSFNECTRGCGTECSLASASEPEGVLWEVALRDNIGGTIEFRADTIEYGVEDDCGIIAFVNDKLSFYAPPGAYLFARKVIG